MVAPRFHNVMQLVQAEAHEEIEALLLKPANPVLGNALLSTAKDWWRGFRCELDAFAFSLKFRERCSQDGSQDSSFPAPS